MPRIGLRVMSEENIQPCRERASKPALLPWALFLPYITDLLFAALVFIAFVLVTWGLYLWGNALGLTNFLVYVRIIELAILSFGTLLCVLFFLKATVEFAKKLIRQLQKPVEGVGGELSSLHPRDIAIRFGEPLRKHNRLWLLVCSGIIFSILYVGVSFAEIIRDDSDAVSIFACEMLCETGPCFPTSVSEGGILETLASYSKYLKRERLPDILRTLTDNPVKGLASASQIMGDIDIKGGQEKAANDIWRAGEEIMLGRLKAPKFLPRGIALHEYRKVPEGLVNDINDALVDSEEAARLFEEKPSLENAIKSCMANRTTMLLLFLARASYNRPEVSSLFTRFRAVVKACIDSKNDIAGEPPYDDPQKKYLATIIAQSEQRRLDILGYTEKGNMQGAIERMWDAIEIAYSRRDELLGLCAKMRKYPIRSARN